MQLSNRTSKKIDKKNWLITKRRRLLGLSELTVTDTKGEFIEYVLMDQSWLTTDDVQYNVWHSKISKLFVIISFLRTGSAYFLLCWHVLFPSPSIWLQWRFLLGLRSPPSAAPSCSAASPPPSTPLFLCLPVFTAPPLPSPPSSVHF